MDKNKELREELEATVLKELKSIIDNNEGGSSETTNEYINALTNTLEVISSQYVVGEEE